VLAELYVRCDGGRLFNEAIELTPSAELGEVDGRWRFATVDGDEIAIDDRGRIWRTDASLEAAIVDGTRLDRWLAGQLDAQATLLDHDGEFADAIFDDDGELLSEVVEAQLRAQLKRDAAAPGPRWRLAQALIARADRDLARAELEQVVADAPDFAWAWLDLARISEHRGELAGALEEARAAAAAAADGAHAGYCWAQLARLAARAADEPARAAAAAEVTRRAPGLRRDQLDGARACLADRDRASAQGLLDLLRAVWPRDLEVLELAGLVAAAPADEPAEAATDGDDEPDAGDEPAN
jgi:tetratricopeptide (TPR) repeat protein